MKIKKYILLLAVFYLSFFIISNKVSANTINKIDMDVYINENGNASITEVWDANLSEGTEGYKKYSNLDNKVISNFKVSDDTGKIYESMPSWDVNASFNDKAYKSGINYVKNGLELCWGISNYATKKYTLKYEISNLVNQFKDNQGIYFDFLDIKQKVNNIRIIIRSDKNFVLDNSRIWAFGYNGTINFEDNKIVLNSNGILNSNQKMIALIRFQKPLFSISSTSNYSFDDIYKSATNELKNNNTNRYIIKPRNVLLILLSCAILIIIIRQIKKSIEYENLKAKENAKYKLHYGKIPKYSKINYYRDIPCNKNIETAYYLCYELSLINENVLKKNIMGAIILKWIKDGKISVIKTENKLSGSLKDNYAIDLSPLKDKSNINSLSLNEMNLLNIFKKASKENKILSAEELKSFSKDNYELINIWFSNIIYNERKRLIDIGLICKENILVKLIFKKSEYVEAYKIDEELDKDAIRLLGLKKFLEDFGRLNAKDYNEIISWEDYFIYAQLFGLANKFSKQFKKIYSYYDNFDVENKLNVFNAINTISNLSYSSTRGGEIKSFYKDMAKNNYNGLNRDSGLGGNSYDSGGKSAGGSSGGGFR